MVESSLSVNKSELVSIAMQMLDELVATGKLSREANEIIRIELKVDDD